jgi:hypothetical protein
VFAPLYPGISQPGIQSGYILHLGKKYLFILLKLSAEKTLWIEKDRAGKAAMKSAVSGELRPGICKKIR